MHMLKHVLLSNQAPIRPPFLKKSQPQRVLSTPSLFNHPKALNSSAPRFGQFQPIKNPTRWHHVPHRYKPLVFVGMWLASYFLLNPNHWFNIQPHEQSYLPRADFIKQLGAEPFDFKSLDKKTDLKGYWIPNKTDQPSGKTMVMGHGYTAQPQQFTNIIKFLKSKGWNVMTFDFRGHGLSTKIHTSIGYNEGFDLGAAFKETFKRHSLPNQPSDNEFDSESKPPLDTLAYLGYSMGAATWAMLNDSIGRTDPTVFNQINNQVKGVILDSSYASFKLSDHQKTEDIAALFKNRPWKETVLYCAKLFGEWRSESYLKTPAPIDAFRPAQAYRNSPLINRPHLHLHGQHDRQFDFKKHGLVFREVLNEGVPKGQLYSADLDADHSDQCWTVGDQTYCQTLRDDKVYLEKLGAFLDTISNQSSQNPIGIKQDYPTA